MEITLPHVTSRKNRDGSLRYYFFRRGQPLARLPGQPDTEQFMAEYQRCLNWVAPAAAAYKGSFEWLCDRYMESHDLLIEPPEWAGRIVAMTAYKGSVVVACERAVFRLQGNTLFPLLFEDEPS